MSIVSHVKLMVVFPSEAVQRVIDTWVRSIKAEAPTTYQKFLARIPTADKFQELIGQPSSDGFQPFVNPSFISRAGEDQQGIKDSQASNLKRSYDKFIEKINHAFETVDGEVAKRFKERIDLMVNAFASGIGFRTLPFTGTKIEGRGPAPLAALWLVKDITVLGQLRAGDKVLEGGPILVTQANQVPSFKAMLNGRLIQAGAAIVKGNFNPTVMAAQNTRINHLIQSLIDPALGLSPFATGGVSHVDYILDGADQLFLDVQVDRI